MEVGNEPFALLGRELVRGFDEDQSPRGEHGRLARPRRDRGGVALIPIQELAVEVVQPLAVGRAEGGAQLRHGEIAQMVLFPHDEVEGGEPLRGERGGEIKRFHRRLPSHGAIRAGLQRGRRQVLRLARRRDGPGPLRVEEHQKSRGEVLGDQPTGLLQRPCLQDAIELEVIGDEKLR